MSFESDTRQIREVLAPVTRFTSRQSIAPPMPLTRLVGREPEVTAACLLLQREDVRLLTLTGTGGIGKTRLALAIASELDANFADGIVWVPLAPIHDPVLVIPAIAKALGIAEANSHSLIDLVQSALSHKQLVLIDNFEQVLTAAPDVAALLISCPALKILATSRSPLRISGERIMPVPPLTLPDPGDAPVLERLIRSEAVHLFAERAEEVSPSFALTDSTAPLVAWICQRLDGLPLAIELAAARVGHLPLGTLYARLERRLPLLTDGPRDVPERLRTMRNAIAWSYDLLSAEEQALFRHLTVFAGGFSLEAAEAVCAPETAETSSQSVIDGLTSLVDKSLVRYVPNALPTPRYMLLETIREYGLEQLATTNDEEAAIRQQHAAYFLALAKQSRTEYSQPRRIPPGWLERLEADHENFRRALAWLAQTNQDLDGLRLANAMSQFWDFRSHLNEGRTWLEHALNPARAFDAPPWLRAETTTNLGIILLRLGDHDHAEFHLENARKAWLSLDEPGSLAFTLLALGGLAEYRGHEERAHSWYEQALALFRETGDLVGTSEALNNLADAAFRGGDLLHAETLAQESLDVGRETRFPVPIIAASITIGEIASARREGRRAVAAFREGLKLSLTQKYHLGIADSLVGLAEVAAATGDLLRAARLLGSAAALADWLGVSRLPHQALQQRAIAATHVVLDETAFTAAFAEGRLLSMDEALAEAYEVSGIHDATTPHPFTPREREILQLLVANRTLREIGEVLFIGTRTVESHVARIYVKLGVHTRAAAISAALGAGLVETDLPSHDHD